MPSQGCSGHTGERGGERYGIGRRRRRGEVCPEERNQRAGRNRLSGLVEAGSVQDAARRDHGVLRAYGMVARGSQLRHLVPGVEGILRERALLCEEVRYTGCY